MNEWKRWGDKAVYLSEYRESIVEATGAINRACRADTPGRSSPEMTLCIRNLRKAIRAIEGLRYRIEEEDPVRYGYKADG